MTQAVAVRRDGDAFQARVFWRKAACLLDPLSPIIRVGFESGPKGFDDVWVAYLPERAPSDQEGKPILREHIQCKWHVSMSDFGYIDLVNPEWVNANSFSLLQRAHAAQLTHAPDGTGSRFKLLTNWRIGQSDPLRAYIHQRSKTLRLKNLFDGTTDRSVAGRIRKLWREHLGITEQELMWLVRTLSLDTDSASLDDHRDNLDLLFENRGLRRIPANESSFIYDDVVFQWLSQGRLEFDRATFREACKRENLLAGEARVHKAFGVKSFEHPFDRLEDRCEVVLDLIPHFDERAIREQTEWSNVLYPKLRIFLQAAGKDNQHVRLTLDAHITLAFAAGSVLNIKSGRQVEIEQRTINRQVWHASDMPKDPTWSTFEFEIAQVNGTASELAVAVCLTHEIATEVLAHVSALLPQVGALLIARPVGGASSRSVACGQHAFDLAESLVSQIKSSRVDRKVAGLHLFIAAPNAFTFFLGQRQPGLGPVTLYEYDFEGIRSGGYEPSLSLPV